MSFDLVRMTSTTTGPGPFTLAASPGHNTFASRYAVGAPIFIGLQGLDANNVPIAERIVGVGQLLGDGRLQVDSVTTGSNGAAPVSFTAASIVVVDVMSVAAVEALASALPPKAHAASHLDGADPLYVLDLFVASRFGGWFPAANVNVVPAPIGAATWVETSAGQSNIAATNLFTSLQRRNYVSTAVAGTVGGGRSQPVLFRGLGGFRYFIEFGIGDAAPVAGARMFAGLRAASGTITDVQIDSQVNMIGVGHEAGDAGLSVFCNDASGAASKVALNASNFPVTTSNVDVYRAEISTRQTAGDVIVVVTNLTTGVSESVVLTADLPATTTLLTPTLFRGNGVSTLATRLELFRILFDAAKGRP